MLRYKCPFNQEYSKMNNLSTKELHKRGYDPLIVTLRSHSNSKYGKTDGKCTTIWEPIEIPQNLILTDSNNPEMLKLHDKNSWGFDNKTFRLPPDEGSLEHIVKWINGELNKKVIQLKKEVQEIFGFEIPKNSKIRKFDVYVVQLVLKHIESGKTLILKRGTIHRKEAIKALVLYSIDGLTMNPKKGAKGLTQDKLWKVGENLTNPEDSFCLMGEKIISKVETLCGDEATFDV